MRLYDIAPETLVPPDVVENGIITAPEQAVPLRDRVVVDINNIAAYWGAHYNMNPDHEWLSPEDSPRPHCPWDRAWFEYDAKNAYPSMYQAEPDAPRLRLGFAIDVHKVDTRFVHILHELAWYPDPRYAEYYGSQWLFVKRHRWDTTLEGEFLAERIVGGKKYKEGVKAQYGISDEEMWHALRRDTFPVWLAMSFAHCKNVSTTTHKTPSKVAKKRRKQGKPIGVTYKTLVIDGMKEVLRTEGGVEKNGLKKALHICRGHFATYTEDKPLFGKVTGTFWKPMHTRGSKKRGEVRKDYKVVADGTKGH